MLYLGLLLIVFFNCCACYNFKVGYLKKSSDTYYENYLKVFNNTHDGITIEEIEFTGTATIENYNSIINSAVENKNCDIILAECDDNLFKITSTHLDNDEVLIMCMNQVSVGRCNKHFISGVTVIPFLKNSIYNYNFI